MASQPESLLTARIRKALSQKWPESFSIKIAGNPYQQGGTPDLLACIEGRFVAFEVKKQRAGETEHHARERATIRQLDRIAKVIAAGGIAGVVLSVDEAIALVDRGLSAPSV